MTTDTTTTTTTRTIYSTDSGLLMHIDAETCMAAAITIDGLRLAHDAEIRIGCHPYASATACPSSANRRSWPGCSWSFTVLTACDVNFRDLFAVHRAGLNIGGQAESVIIGLLIEARQPRCRDLCDAEMLSRSRGVGPSQRFRKQHVDPASVLVDIDVAPIEVEDAIGAARDTDGYNASASQQFCAEFVLGVPTSDNLFLTEQGLEEVELFLSLARYARMQ